jgi:excisionase family DNA binding protein
MPVTRTALGAPDPDPDPDYRWLGAEAAADELGTSVRDVYELVDGGDLPAYRIDGEVRLRRSDVERVRDQHRGSNGTGRLGGM